MDKCARCRKFATKLFLKGDRCNTPKCSLTRRNYQPGSHGNKRGNSRKSEYGLQLLEKQKAKAEYGLRERQFAALFRKAVKSKTNTGEELFQRLEMRLDNSLYRLGWAASRAQARQLVLHRKIKLNDKITNIPSLILKPQDKIAPVAKEVITPVKISVPKWLRLDEKTLSAQVENKPTKEEINSDINDQLIIEFYSR